MFSSTSSYVRKFRRDESGALIIFGLMLFVLMIMLSGLAVDLMRVENTRVKLENTLDRATLAAAAISQKLDRKSVVKDYMLKAGLADQLDTVTVTESMNATSVLSTGHVSVQPFFTQMMGMTSLAAGGVSRAEQAITNLEIVLVLDVSGSMSGTKIANLKVAADQFVDTLMDSDPNHRVSISIVPYNAQVNIGPDLVTKFNITHKNNVDANKDGLTDVNCIEIPAASFGSLALSQTDPLPMMAYADIASRTSKIDGYVTNVDPTNAKPNYSSTFCKPSTVNVVRLPNNDRNVLKSQIDALQAGGNTSITLGMKWGATMIDPSLRTAYTDFIRQGKIPANLPARPFAYDDGQAMKIIVLMTDGEHVSHNRVNDAYKTGPSPIYRSLRDGLYSVRYATNRPAIAGTKEYWVPHLAIDAAHAANGWRATPWGTEDDGVINMDWRDVWASLKMPYVAWQFFARATGTDITTRNAIYNSMMNTMQSTWASVNQMDASLDQTCDLVKVQGVVVYGVAVDAPTHGQDVIKSCATSPLHYFEASPEGIVSAFATIASNITMLKLTQ